jgi:hypothetical protein
MKSAFQHSLKNKVPGSVLVEARRGRTTACEKTKSFCQDNYSKKARGPRSRDREHTARLRLDRQLLADGGSRIADLIDSFLQVFLGHVQVLDPVVKLLPAVQVYLAAIRLELMCQARHIAR